MAAGIRAWATTVMASLGTMRSFAIAACLVLVCSAAACGSSGDDTAGVRLTSNNVRSAFSASGIPVREFGAALGIDKYVNASFFRGITSKKPWIEIEIFKTPRSATAAWTAGGNIADPDDGQIIQPLAIIHNVLITEFKSATPAQRTKTLKAVRLLRQQR